MPGKVKFSEMFLKQDQAIYVSIDKTKEHVKKMLEKNQNNGRKIKEEIQKYKTQEKVFKTKLARKKLLEKPDVQKLKSDLKNVGGRVKAAEKELLLIQREYNYIKEKQQQYIALERMAVKFVSRPKMPAKN